MRLPSYPLYDRWLNEERVGRHIADLIQITDPTLLSAAAKQGFVANYKPAGGAQIYPGLKEDGVWYALSVDYMGIGYNAQQSDAGGGEAPPRCRLGCARRSALEGPLRHRDAGLRRQQLRVLLHVPASHLKDRYGETWFKKLAANKPDIYASKAPLFERLAAGEYAIMDQGSQGTLTELFLKGAPVRWVFPAPTPAAATVQSISAHAPHPNAARLFQEWSVSPEAEALWISLESAGATRPDVVDPAQARPQGLVSRKAGSPNRPSSTTNI